MMLAFQSRLAAGIQAAVRSDLGAELPSVTFQYPKHLELGDLALTAPFDLAKTLRRKPREIAETLAARLGSLPEVRKAEVAGGGYVNLFLARAPFARRLSASLREPAPPPSHVDRVILPGDLDFPRAGDDVSRTSSAGVDLLGHFGRAPVAEAQGRDAE